MNKGKYFDWRKIKSIDENDISEYLDWISPGRYSCTVHPKGYKMFISKQEINIKNEYADGDLYTVDINHNVFHRARIESTIHLIDKCFEKEHFFKLLDIGCGKGYITNRIQNNFPNAEISALDYSVSAIDFAFENFKNIDFIVADAYNLPYSENYYDIVVCNNIWEHVPDPLNMLKEIQKILKKNGYLIISTPSRFRLGNVLRIISGTSPIFLSSMHITEYTIRQIIEQLQYGKFKTVQVYSKKNYEVKGIKQVFIYYVVKPTLKFLLKFTSISPHTFESTCYFLAVNEKN